MIKPGRLPNLFLLLALIAQVLLYPLLETWAHGRAALAAVDWLILALALRAARSTGEETRLGYVLMVPAMATNALVAFVPETSLLILSFVAQAAFHTFIIVCLLRYILQDDDMTLDELFAAASLYVLMAFAFSFVLAGVVTSLPFAGVLAAVLFASAPLLYVRNVARRRLAKFEEQFPEAIDLIARALRAGHALTTALQLAGDELPEPVGPEFQMLFDRQNYGMSLPDALREFAARIPLLDARFFVTAVLIQRETGGNLSSVLDNLANVIRERFKVKRQVRVMSAHGRITGWALGMLPPVVGALLFMLSPDLMSVLITDPLGNMLLAVGFGLQVIGVLIIRRILDVEF